VARGDAAAGGLACAWHNKNKYTIWRRNRTFSLHTWFANKMARNSVVLFRAM
jgi:hypothetical protein